MVGYFLQENPTDVSATDEAAEAGARTVTAPTKVAGTSSSQLPVQSMPPMP